MVYSINDGDINRNFKMMPLCNFLICLFIYWYNVIIPEISVEYVR